MRSVQSLPEQSTVLVAEPPSKWRMVAPYIATASVGMWTLVGARIYCSNVLAAVLVWALTVLLLFYTRTTTRDLLWRFMFAWWISIPFACILCVTEGRSTFALPTASPTRMPTGMPTLTPANATSL